MNEHPNYQFLSRMLKQNCIQECKGYTYHPIFCFIQHAAIASSKKRYYTHVRSVMI